MFRSGSHAVYAHLFLAASILACHPQPRASLAPDCDSGKTATAATKPPPPSAAIKAAYEKRQVRIPMRDGTELFTTIYSPRDQTQTYPILFNRTPYSVRPYDPAEYPDKLGPSPSIAASKYIFVYQDVRGSFMSQGQFQDMRPHLGPNRKPGEVDENTDTYDSIEWLLKNVQGHNGRVGMWGISYPGFYAATGMIDAHPALAAVSPQAPIADWYFDDFHHHGAFFLPHAFNFLASFGKPRPHPTTERHPRFAHDTPDGYAFFMALGSLENANKRYLNNLVPMWNNMVEHPNYDEFWQARNLLPHLKQVAPAVMTVGGWFDAEDLYGPLQIYRAIEQQNPESFNMLVMGPWGHGGWARTEGDRLGNVMFGGKHSQHYQQEIELRFFEHYLKGDGSEAHNLPEAYVFETGTNRWRSFETWPPSQVHAQSLYLADQGALIATEPSVARGVDSFVSDPHHPVPYTQEITTGMTKEYMTDDQRFAARRSDVLTYQTQPLAQAMTVAGPLTANLWVSTSQSDADWIVKVIDVYPDSTPDPDGLAPGVHHGGYAQMVRSEVFRGRYRNSYSSPQPFTPDQPTAVRIPLQDILHTFKPGHRLMVQIQSTWFPIVDRNPQKYVDNIFEAKDTDFTVATHRVYHDKKHPSFVEFDVLETR